MKRHASPNRLSICAWGVLLVAAFSQSAGAQSTRFGAPARAAAAEDMIVLGVEQALASLPPTSGQAYTYEFDPTLATYVPSARLGPAAFRSPQTLGFQNLSFQLTTAYFELSDRFGPVDYAVDGPLAKDALSNLHVTYPQVDVNGSLLTRLGLQADAKVTLVNLAAAYGLAENLDMFINVPLVVTHAHASEVFLQNENFPGQIFAPAAAPPQEFFNDTMIPCKGGQGDCLIDYNLSTGHYDYASQRFSKINPPIDFADGTNFGVGRISFGEKWGFRPAERLQMALEPEFFAPSPNRNELAGADSAALQLRWLTSVTLANWSRLHFDLGYTHDFGQAELTRFSWTTGVSFPLLLEWANQLPLTLDAGVSGSEFDRGITWTPAVATFRDDLGRTNTLTLRGGDNQLGTTLVDFLGGLKVQLAKQLILSGGVSVPLNGEGFRPAALGTLGLEYRI